jgi:NitT/TauT family transport system permease protein
MNGPVPMKKRIAAVTSPWRGRIIQSLPLVGFLMFWQFYCGTSAQRAFYFATPLRVMETLVRDLRDGSLLGHMAVTGGEAVAGFLLGNVVGAAIGLSLWYSAPIARASRPYLVAIGAVPVFALAPMTIIWFGVGIGAKIALAFMGTVFVAATQAYRGAEQVDPLLLRRFRIFGASRGRLFRLLLLPASAVWVVSSLRLTIGLGLLGAFIGEFIAANRGLGYLIVKAGGLYDTPRVIAGVIAIVAIAMLLDKGVDLIEQRALRWKAVEPPPGTLPTGGSAR